MQRWRRCAKSLTTCRKIIRNGRGTTVCLRAISDAPGNYNYAENDIIELKIEDMGVDGEGIGKYDGMTFFVKDAVLGDEIEARITKMKKIMVMREWSRFYRRLNFV